MVSMTTLQWQTFPHSCIVLEYFVWDEKNLSFLKDLNEKGKK